MKRSYIVSILLVLSVVCSFPIAGIIYRHVAKTKRLQLLNSHVLSLKLERDRSAAISKKNTALMLNRKSFRYEDFQQASQAIILLQKERETLASLPKDSLITHSKEVWARQKTINNSNNRLIWFTEDLGDDLICIRLQSPVEVDSKNIQEIFYLLNPDNSNAPLAFFTHWEMTKHVTPLGNEVWFINAEAISRCL
ncbi:putative lipoprotein [Chlamydia ibidis]|uniref:Lipoprotein n=2 Tax=Chlamydia ibidis TaxID=1405396 RepID=A0ABP2XG31_9CHLA|nr:hypothetical protein [Chlamydia ibidis]EPP34494.1 putative lipoprotein [Chlamydia ibidis]EQM63214.1 putative lipoprotein [Chlamydia ibidis 10-1398/6]